MLSASMAARKSSSSMLGQSSPVSWAYEVARSPAAGPLIRSAVTKSPVKPGGGCDPEGYSVKSNDRGCAVRQLLDGVGEKADRQRREFYHAPIVECDCRRA